MKRNKISLIGAGNIGGTLAHLCILKKLGDIVLFDIQEHIAKGKALDLSQICPIENLDANVIGTSDYKDIQDSDVIIITAGVARKPGMSRDDLLEINTKVMKSVGEGIKKYAPLAFVICITNPLDVMVSVLQHFSGIKDNMIVGMAGVLDSARFRTFLSQELKVSVSQVYAYVMGGHGDTMVPLTSISNICGQSLKDCVAKNLITQEKLDAIIDRTRKGGGEIVSLLKTGSAYYAPATSAISMAESFLQDKKMILPCASKVKKGMYNLEEDLFIGVPTKIDKNGAFPIEVGLSKNEMESLAKSTQSVVELNKAAKKFLYV